MVVLLRESRCGGFPMAHPVTSLRGHQIFPVDIDKPIHLSVFREIIPPCCDLSYDVGVTDPENVAKWRDSQKEVAPNTLIRRM